MLRENNLRRSFTGYFEQVAAGKAGRIGPAEAAEVGRPAACGLPIVAPTAEPARHRVQLARVSDRCRDLFAAQHTPVAGCECWQASSKWERFPDSYLEPGSRFFPLHPSA